MKKVFFYYFIASFTLNALIPFNNNTLHLELSLSIMIPIFSNYLLYPIIGYLLDKNALSKRTRTIVYILGVLGLLLHMVGTYVL